MDFEGTFHKIYERGLLGNVPKNKKTKKKHKLTKNQSIME